MTMTRIMTICTLASCLLVLGCKSRSTEGEPPESGTGMEMTETTATTPMSGTTSLTAEVEDPRESTKRLRYLENGIEQWNDADYRQEYARRDSMTSLLRTYTRDHFDDVLRDLGSGSPRRRAVMAGALGFSGRQEAVQPLIGALEDQYYEVVLHSLASLYHLGRSRDANGKKLKIKIDPAPIVPFLSHPRSDVRSNAALALSRALTPESPLEYLVPLASALEDQDDATRVHAVAAIGAMRHREGMPYLIAALEDPVQLVRVRAALGLGRVEQITAVPSLIGVLERKGEANDVKKAASRALAAILKKKPSLEPGYWREAAASISGDEL